MSKDVEQPFRLLQATIVGGPTRFCDNTLEYIMTSCVNSHNMSILWKNATTSSSTIWHLLRIAGKQGSSWI